MVLNESDISVLSMTLPVATQLQVYDETLFTEESQIYFFRAAPGSNIFQLEGRTAFFLRAPRFYMEGGRRLIELNAESALSVLRDTQIPYEEYSPYTLKVEPADDSAKALVRENRGTLALDTTRDISQWLSVEADKSKAQIVFKENISKRNVLDVIRELAQASEEYGTWMGFDIVVDSLVNKTFRFETYTVTSDIDHRFPNGTKPLLFTESNVNNPSLTIDASEAATVAYAYGPGEGILQPQATAIDTVRVGLGPFARREVGVNASDAAEQDELQGAANAELKAKRPRYIFEADLSDTPQAIYGRDFRKGSLITINAFGRKMDCRISQVEIELGENGAGERVSIKARSIT